jgi:hypothetical protein
MVKLFVGLLLGLWLVAPAQTWLDPATYPNALRCDTTGSGLVQKYAQAYRANPAPLYSIRTTPQIPGTGDGPTNPPRYKSPVIDGFLENDIWSNAETLLVNSWEDAGRTYACGDNRRFNGPIDMHAIWRFCYNHDGMYVSCEIHDDIFDVDSLGGWFIQDGIEISVDPWDWGDYARGLWNDGSKPANNVFRRYWSNNRQIMTYTDNAHENFFHLLKRSVNEPYVTGLIKGVHKANYPLGQEATNFIRGDAACHGIDFAAQLRGVDNWGRAIVHHEYKFPYHGSLWSTLSRSGSGYYSTSTSLLNGTMLPAEGTLFKVDVMNNDDDIPGANGANPTHVQLGRRRGTNDGFAQESANHWSDTKYFMVFRYAGTAQTYVANVSSGSLEHGYAQIVGGWVDAATETERYDFTSPGTIRIGSNSHYYDSTGKSGNNVTGTLTAIQGGAVTGSFVYKKHVSNHFLDTIVLTITGQSALTLIPAFSTGFTELEGIWMKATMEVATACQNGFADTALSVISGDSGGKTFRFLPLSKLPDDSTMPVRYRGCTDSLRIYKTGTEEILDVMTYIAKPKQLVRSRTQPYADYEFTKVTKAKDPNAPSQLIVTYLDGKKDTLVKISPLNTLTFGETHITYLDGDNMIKTNSDPIMLRPVDKLDISWRIAVYKYDNRIEILDSDSGKWRGVIPKTGEFYNSRKTYPATWGGSKIEGFLLSTSKIDSNSTLDSNFLMGTKIYGCDLSADTVILEGYNPDTKVATSRRQKPHNEFAPDNGWLEQTVRFILTNGALADTFIFRDTTQVKHWLYVNGTPFSTGSSVYNTIDTNSNNLCEKISAEGFKNTVEEFAVGVYPNPFNPTTVLNVSVPSSLAGKEVTLHVYNARGQLVRTLLKSTVTRVGFSKKIVWHGENNLGGKIASGLYYYRLTAGNRVLKGSLVMIK